MITAVEEHPMLFAPELVRAILAGKKTQTRRPLRRQPIELDDGSYSMWRRNCGDTNIRREVVIKNSTDGPQQVSSRDYHLPLDEWLLELNPIKAGHRIWVRETWAHEGDKSKPVGYRADGAWGSIGGDGDGSWSFYRHGWIQGVADNSRDGRWVGMGYVGTKWRPSIHMPRWACRLVLEVTNVRVQHIQDISESDSIAEGIVECPIPADEDGPNRIGYMPYPDDGKSVLQPRAKQSFEKLWRSIYTGYKQSWEENPLVYAYSFTRV